MPDVCACWADGCVADGQRALIGAGNPSDGYNGKTISLSIANFWASVSIEPSAKLVRVMRPCHYLRLAAPGAARAERSDGVWFFERSVQHQQS